MKNDLFQVSGSPTIELAVSCDVLIEESHGSQVSVQIEGSEDAIAQFKVKQLGNTISVEQERTRGSGNIFTVGSTVMNMSGDGMSVSSINGNTYISGGSGKVFVNGKAVDLGASVSETKVRLLISTPSGGGLEAKLQGSTVLVSTCYFDEAFVEIEGSSSAALYSGSLDIRVSGGAKIKAKLNAGELTASVAGSADIEVLGSMSKASVNISGSGKVVTVGDCVGDYRADVSGSGKVTHRGSIGGRIRKSVSGSGSINL